MNYKITAEQNARLEEYSNHKLLFGSRLFGNFTPESDFDYIRIYDFEEVFGKEEIYSLPNVHSFQYDDVENNAQYVWMTERQFLSSIFSGDGTHCIDSLLFSYEYYIDNDRELSLFRGDKVILDEIKLKRFRTYKIIKAYLGVAKRDLKLHGNDPKKRYHAERSIYIAAKLFYGELPTLYDISNIFKYPRETRETLQEAEKVLRNELNNALEMGKIQMYEPVESLFSDDLLELFYGLNNIREFKYDK